MIPGFGRDVRSLWFIQTWCSHDVPMMSLDHPTVSSVKDHAAAAPKCAKWPQMDLFAGAHGVILNRWLDHIICFEKWMFQQKFINIPPTKMQNWCEYSSPKTFTTLRQRKRNDESSPISSTPVWWVIPFKKLDQLDQLTKVDQSVTSCYY